jgi:hypothetical protein
MHISWNEIVDTMKCSRSTVARLAKTIQEVPDPYGKGSDTLCSPNVSAEIMKMIKGAELEVEYVPGFEQKRQTL